MSNLSQSQIDSIQKLYSLCYSLRDSKAQPLTDIARVTKIPDGRVMISIDNNYFKYDQRITFYIGNLIEYSKINIEQGIDCKSLIFQNSNDMLNFMNLAYLEAKSPKIKEKIVINGEMRLTFGEVFNQYFDIKDLDKLSSNNEVLIDTMTSEIINNITIKFNDISEGDEAAKLFEGEIRKSLILTSFLTNFPELESRMMLILESKLKPRIESLESRLNQLSDVTDEMNEGRKFLK